MRKTAKEVSLADGEATRHRPPGRRADHPVAESAPDPGLSAWSRLWVVEQTTILIAKHVLRLQGDGSVERRPTRRRSRG
jgi:hypothetical protein